METHKRIELEFEEMNAYIERLVENNESLAGVKKMRFFHERVKELYIALADGETDFQFIKEGLNQLQERQPQREYEFWQKQPLWQITSDLIKAHEFVLDHYPLNKTRIINDWHQRKIPD